jgi:hypothetical protein
VSYQSTCHVHRASIACDKLRSDHKLEGVEPGNRSLRNHGQSRCRRRTDGVGSGDTAVLRLSHVTSTAAVVRRPKALSSNHLYVLPTALMGTRWVRLRMTWDDD